MATPVLAALSPLAVLATAIRHFVLSCREPYLLEKGEPAIGLIRAPEEANWNTDRSGRWLILEAWDRDHLLSRKIRGIRSQSSERMELITDRLGGKTGSLVVYDAFRPGNTGLAQKGRRLVFAERFRTLLRREFSGARIERFHTDADLEHSLSPAYPRALLRTGSTHLAAIAAPPGSDVDGVLSFGLTWLDYLRTAGRAPLTSGLAVFVPHGRVTTTCLRVLHLNRAAASFSVIAYDESGQTLVLDPTDAGNLETHIPPLNGSAPDRQRIEPEAVIEDEIRQQIQVLDARLCPQPVYGQVPNFSGSDRGILDLLAVDYTGRLTVIELKATESVHLPLQALDYWLRVKWHLERGDFSRLGYFPGITLQDVPPRLILAGPALRFHPSNERLLAYFRPDIEVARIGLAEGFGSIRVLYRY